MSPERPQKGLEPLERNVALRHTLSGWCEHNGEENGPMTFDEVVLEIGKNRMLLNNVRAYLGPGGAGYEADMEVADHMRERLAWALVDHLANSG